MEKNENESKSPGFGARHIFVILGALGFANVYAMRVNLSVAIVYMVNYTAINNSSSTNSTSNHDGPFVWDEAKQGIILGMFFYGYVLTQFPGGRLAELIGGKWLFGIGVLITAVFTLLTPIAANTSIYFLYVVRIIEGLGEGVTFPAMLAMIARWSSPQERSRFTAFSYAGACLGTVISMPACGYLCEYVGWESAFYVFGAIGIVWFIFWAFLVFDSPDKHPRISQKEKEFLESCLTQFEAEKPKSIPWKSIVTSVPVWAIVATHVTQNFGYYVLLTELPNYMKNVLNWDLKSKGVLSGMPYLAMWIVSMIGSVVVDHIIEKEMFFSRTGIRKISNTIATFGPAMALLGASFVGHNPTAAMALLIVAVGCNGFIYAGEQSAMLDIANNFAGTLMGVINALGNTMGFVAPMIVGYIIKGHNDVQHWQYVFWIATSVYTFGTIMFLLFGSAVEQPWNREAEIIDSYAHLGHDNPAYSVSVSQYDDTVMKK